MADNKVPPQQTFTADFTSVKQGGTNGYVLQPVADGTSVEYENGTEE